MTDLSYLRNLLNTDKLGDYPELEDFFAQYARKIKVRNAENYDSFLKFYELSPSSNGELFAELNRIIFTIEKSFQQKFEIQDYSTPSDIYKTFQLAKKYFHAFSGPFLKKETAKKLIETNPLEKTRQEIGKEKYNETDPLYLLAIGRYAEADEWNQRHVEALSQLKLDDLETRETQLFIVESDVFTTASNNIIKKKCFNSHDKIIGCHIVSTLPKDFDLSGKAPFLRTLTKMIHYQKEMEIFSRVFQSLLNNYPEEFGNKIHEILKRHKFNSNAPLFSTHDVIEGLANREIDKKLMDMARDFKELEPWAKVHQVAHFENNHFQSLQLWRLTSWHLNGTCEQTLKMYRDNVVADMLIELFNEKSLEDKIGAALAHNAPDIYQFAS